MNRLRIKIDQPSDVFVVTANSEKARALGQITDIKTAIQHIAIPITLQVIESPNETLLLGTDWFSKTNAKLDFGNQQVILHYDNKTITVPVTQYANEEPKCIAFNDNNNEIIKALDNKNDNEFEYEDEEVETQEFYSVYSDESDSDSFEKNMPIDWNP
jgi:hypothetical protein